MRLSGMGAHGKPCRIPCIAPVEPQDRWRWSGTDSVRGGATLSRFIETSDD